MEFHPNDFSDLDELTEEHLGFSALSEGLGFSKSKKAAPASPPREEEPSPALPKSSGGIGAVAAGPMRPAPGITARPVASPAPAPVSAAAKILAEPAAPRVLRMGAFLLDLLFVFVPMACAWFLSFGGQSEEIFLQDPRSPLALTAVILAAYFLLSESFGGQSLGKMIFGLRVVEDDKYQKPTGLKHAVARIGLFLVGVVFFGLGLFASFWDSKRRPWHDRFSSSIVRRA
jgi:uncharacterized RDD family membrane protein YckC